MQIGLRRLSGSKETPKSQDREDGPEGEISFAEHLKDSVLPMFHPQLGERAVEPNLWDEVVREYRTRRYEAVVGYFFDWDEFKEGLAQARKYVIERYAEDDFDAIARVAAPRVVEAFKLTRSLHENTEFTHKYEMKEIKSISHNNTFIRFYPDNSTTRNEDGNYVYDFFAYQSGMIQRDPLLCFLHPYLPLRASGRVDMDMTFHNYERLQVARKDTGELLHKDMEDFHLVERTWRFSKEFSPERKNHPWIFTAIRG